MRTDDPLERRLRTVCEGDGRDDDRVGVGIRESAEPGISVRAAITTWTRPAVRSMVVLVCLALVVAGYWAWSGRPREVAAAPTILATGAPVSGVAASRAPVPLASAPAMEAPSPLASAPAPFAADIPVAPSTPVVPMVVVHVTGLVHMPGVIELPQGSRVADAIDRAGGVTKPRASSSVNLARVLVDGEQVVVGLPTGAVAPAPAAGSSGSGSSPGAPMMLNLNTADAAALETLPGIGPVIAERIVAWRTANGPFRTVDELGEVAGIGDSILSQVRSSVWV